jgi:hypothetical protein
MSDNLRVYRAVHDALYQLSPTEPKGHHARHLTTLAMLICGIVQSQCSQLPALARKVPERAQPQSRVKRFSRWLQHEGITPEAFYLPFAEAVLGALSGPLCLVIDSSDVGDGCCAWVVSVIYKKRALPLCWTVKPVKKGHASDEAHLELLRAVKAVLPKGGAGRRVIFLGDGEFDGVPLQQALSEWGFEYALRTARNRKLSEPFGGESLGFSFHQLAPSPGETLWVEGASFTGEGFGPVLAVATWPADLEEPVYLVSNMDLPQEACFWYRKRFRIETFFSDQKSRGFRLHESHLSDPQRLARLMIGTCLAYLWIVFLGAMAKRDGWKDKLHRRSRCDWSLFRLGLALLDELLNQCLEIPVFLSPPPSLRSISVR